MKMFFGNQQRQNRAANGRVERTHDSDQRAHDVNRVHGVRSANRDRQQQRRADRESRVADGENLAAVEAVGRVPRHEKKQDAGKELREAHEAEIERTLRDFVDLPADRDRLHFRGKHDAESRDLIEHKSGIGERDTSGEIGFPGSSHR